MKEFTREFLTLIIRPTLQKMTGETQKNFWSKNAEDLVLGTALAETGLREIEQGRGRKQGPAIGFFQIEPDTHDSIWQNYIAYRFWLAEAIGRAAFLPHYLFYNEVGVKTPPHILLIGNLFYSVAICRVIYFPKKGEIPLHPEDQAEYWLKHYNAGGKGSVEHYLEAWENR